MNYEAIKKAAEGYKSDMAKFLRDMIAIPSESCEEERVVKRIAAELEKLGYDKVEIDKLGYVIVNGQKTGTFWNAKIYSPKQPLRLKIRNICGDETVFSLQ